MEITEPEIPTNSLRSHLFIESILADTQLFQYWGHSFQQHLDASMGSQWAPIFCSAVALLREWTFHASFRLFRTNRGFHHCYVDNRILLHTGFDSATPGGRLFWRFDFYTKPILLGHVTGDEALGYRIDRLQNSITLRLPWELKKLAVSCPTFLALVTHPHVV